MRMRALQNIVWVGLGAIALSIPAASAQQSQQPQQSTQQVPDQASGPIPAYRSPLASAAGNDQDEEEPQELAPDNRSLSGARDLSLGVPTTRSYWQPHFDLSATADSNALETARSPGWGSWISLSGGVDIHRTSESNDMNVNYTSGGMFSNLSRIGDGAVQMLDFEDKIAFHRSSLSFIDNLNYLPESAFGYGGLGGNALPGGTSAGLSFPFTPGQSVLTGYGQNLGNSFATELDTFLTPRTSLTLVGGDAQQDFFDNDLLNYGDFSFRGGYNYQMTRQDTLAVLYTFGGVRYSNSNQSIDSHTVQVSYGRRVTGRLAFQIAAGPAVVISRIPITGNGGSAGNGRGAGTNATQLVSALNTSLQWRTERNVLALTYIREASGGSGVLLGAISDIVSGSMTRQVSRTFSDGLIAGYSRNQGMAIKSATLSGQTYDYWYAGASLAHPMGQALGLTFSYQMQYQTSNSPFCLGPTCGTSVIRHMISVGVGWHEHPLLF